MLERRSRQKPLVADMDRHVVAIDLEVVDRVRIQKMKAVGALADEPSDAANHGA